MPCGGNLRGSTPDAADPSWPAAAAPLCVAVTAMNATDAPEGSADHHLSQMERKGIESC